MKYLLTILSLVLFSNYATAGEGFYFSALAGYTHVDQAEETWDLGEQPSLGFRAGVLPLENFGLGVFVQYLRAEGVDYLSSNVGSDVNITNYMLEGTYYLSSAKENSLYVAGMFGFTNTYANFDSTFTRVNETDFAFGGSVGYQFELVKDTLMIAPQVTYFHVDTDTSNFKEVSALANLTFYL